MTAVLSLTLLPEGGDILIDSDEGFKTKHGVSDDDISMTYNSVCVI